MSYDLEELKATAIKKIEEHKLFFIEDIISYLPCSKSTFYNMQMHELDDIKEALQKVKTEIKVSQRSKWYKSNAPALQMGLYKLIGTEEERKRLSQTYTDLTTGGEKIGVEDLSGLSDEELDQYMSIKMKLKDQKRSGQ